MFDRTAVMAPILTGTYFLARVSFVDLMISNGPDSYDDVQLLTDAEKILSPVTLPCGRVVPNRLVKVCAALLLFPHCLEPKALCFFPPVIHHAHSYVDWCLIPYVMSAPMTSCLHE